MKTYRDCPQCGTTYGSVREMGVCPNCNYKIRATSTHIALAGRLGACGIDGLVRAIAAYHKVPAFMPLDQPACEVTADKIARWDLLEFNVFPVLFDSQLYIATEDPGKERVVAMLESHLGAVPKFAVAHAGEIKQRIFGLEDSADEANLQQAEQRRTARIRGEQEQRQTLQFFKDRKHDPNANVNDLVAGSNDEQLLYELSYRIKSPANPAQELYVNVWTISEFIPMDGFEAFFERNRGIDEVIQSFTEIGFPDAAPIFRTLESIVPDHLLGHIDQTALRKHIVDNYDRLHQLMLEFLELTSTRLYPAMAEYVRTHREAFAGLFD